MERILLGGNMKKVIVATILLIGISLLLINNRMIDEIKAIKIATEGLNQDFVIVNKSLIKETEKLNSFITKYYDIENPEQYKAIWFVSYEINDGKELSSIYIDAQSGEVLSSWLISDENGDVLDKSFLGK